MAGSGSVSKTWGSSPKINYQFTGGKMKEFVEESLEKFDCCNAYNMFCYICCQLESNK